MAFRFARDMLAGRFGKNKSLSSWTRCSPRSLTDDGTEFGNPAAANQKAYAERNHEDIRRGRETNGSQSEQGRLPVPGNKHPHLSGACIAEKPFGVLSAVDRTPV